MTYILWLWKTDLPVPTTTVVPAQIRTVISWGATDSAALRHEEGVTTVQVKTVNMSGIRVAQETTNHPHVVMWGVKTNMTQDIKVGIEAVDGVAMRKINLRRERSAS